MAQGVTVIDMIRNRVMRERRDISMSVRQGTCLLNWFRRVERTDEGRRHTDRVCKLADGVKEKSSLTRGTKLIQ